MKKSRFLVFILLALSIGVAFLGGIKSLDAVAYSEIPDTPENRALMAALENGYDVIVQAAIANDVSRLPEVLADMKDYIPPDDVKKGIELIYGAKAVSSAGYLTAMTTKYILTTKVLSEINEAKLRAKAENRELSGKELQDIIKANNGVIPPTGVYSKENMKTQIVYKKIIIEGTKATIYYDTLSAYEVATLRLINGKWLITNIEAINIHY